jgi:putative endonuclease
MAVIASEAKQSHFACVCLAEIASSRSRAPRNDGLAMEKHYYAYILTNKRHTVLYTGVTSDLKKRVYQHRMKLVPGFTSRYNVNELLYYEVFDDAYTAISREKQIKAGSRAKKLDLINGMNPQWVDLYETL